MTEIDDIPYVENMSVTFSQNGDCNTSEIPQSIEFHLESNGVANFIWIKTDRWSFADADELQKLVDRVRAMEKVDENNPDRIFLDNGFKEKHNFQR